MRRVAKADAWDYVMTNYGGLIMYYAKTYAERQKRGEYLELVKDYESEIRYEMVRVYEDYYIKQERPLVDVTKMLKCVPYYYYWNVILKKQNIVDYVEVEALDYMEEVSWSYISVCEVGDIGKLYDYYYEMFIDHAYNLKDEFQGKDECEILALILAPSMEYRDFVMRSPNIKRFMSINALKEFFKKRKKWTEGRFINTIETMKSKIESLLVA